MSEQGKKKNGEIEEIPRGLLSPPQRSERDKHERVCSTQDAMGELLDETFNSDSLDEGHSLVGLDEPSAAPEDTAPPLLAGPTSPEARARRYKKLKPDENFWDEVDKGEDRR